LEKSGFFSLLMNSLKREFLSFKTSDKKKRIENEVSRIRDVSEWKSNRDGDQISEEIHYLKLYYK